MLFSSSMMISSVELTSKASKQLKHNPRTIKNGRMCQGNSNDFMQNQMTFTTKMSTTSSQLQAHQIDAKHLSNPRYPRVSPLEACTPWSVITWPGHIFGLWISQKLPMVPWWNFTTVKRSAPYIKRGPKKCLPLFFSERTEPRDIGGSAIPSTWWWRAFARYHPWASVSDWSRDCYLNAHLSVCTEMSMEALWNGFGGCNLAVGGLGDSFTIMP